MPAAQPSRCSCRRLDVPVGQSVEFETVGIYREVRGPVVLPARPTVTWRTILLHGFAETVTDKSGKPVVIVRDLVVPPSGPQGAVNPGSFSLVQEFDLGWLLDPGCQRLLDNLAASPGAFGTVRVMKVFTNNIATVTTSRPAGPNESGVTGSPSSGNVWPAGGPIDLTGTLNGLYELTRRQLIPFVVLGFFPDGVYTNTSYASASPGPYGPSTPFTETTRLAANPRKLADSGQGILRCVACGYSIRRRRHQSVVVRGLERARRRLLLESGLRSPEPGYPDPGQLPDPVPGDVRSRPEPLCRSAGRPHHHGP